jgi:hypothetical protein
MLTSSRAWEIIATKAEQDRWLTVADLYALVEQSTELDESDRAPVAEHGQSTRWHRTVRNALQQAKRRGAVEWQRGQGFRLTGAPSGSP